MRSLTLLLCAISVVNGFSCDSKTAESKHPYLVRITSYGGRRCGGTIIDDSHILTSAECVYDREPEDIVAVLGTEFTNEDGDRYVIQKVYSHPKYNETSGYNNIALISLVNKLKFSSKIQPITLSSESNIHIETTATLLGWERDTEEQYKILEMQQIIVPLEQCHDFPQAPINYHTLCTRTLNTNMCFNQMGNPLIVNCTQIGIIKDFTSCFVIPNTYTMVAPHLYWIKGITKSIQISAGNQMYLNTWIVLSYTILMLLSYSVI